MIIGLLLLAGCAGKDPRPTWSGGSGNFAQDNYACVRESTYTHTSGYINAYGGAVSSGPGLNRPQYVLCMEARGYTLVCQPETHLNADRDKCKR